MPTAEIFSSGCLVPFLWDLHMFYLLRPILFPNLSLFFRSMLFKYHSVLTRFCSKEHVFFFMQNSRKPWICISYSFKRSSASYWLHNDSLYNKRFLLQHTSIFLHVIFHTYCVFYPRRTLFDLGNTGKCQTCSWNFASFLCIEPQPSLLYDDDTLIHAANDMKKTFVLVGSKDTRSKMMVILWHWTLHWFHTQTLQSLHTDWWYIKRDFS